MSNIVENNTTQEPLTHWQEAYTRAQTEIAALKAEQARLAQQVAWFKQQIFGSKSERRFADTLSQQLNLGQAGELSTTINPLAPPATETITYTRNKTKRTDLAAINETGLRFGPEVEVKEIRVIPDAIRDLKPDEYDVISEKWTHRLAQRPGAYVVLKYIQPVVKIKADQSLQSAAAPAAVLEKSYADVSVLAGILVDKFVAHLPLYRIHQRLLAAGIELDRGTLTHWVHRSLALLEPVYGALLASIRSGGTVALDETPMKATRKEKGKMKQAYFWPVYGEQDEVAFPFFMNRSRHCIDEILKGFKGTLITDGYAAYTSYARTIEDIEHAHCWTHLRRMFLKAEAMEPDRVAQALNWIRLLYAHEAEIKDRQLEGSAKLDYRQTHSAPVVDGFFAWVRIQVDAHGILPADDFFKAASFALKHEATYRVFLARPEVEMDTNHLERALRVIPMGRKAWMFCWTEVGAKYVGIAQSLLVTCKLHGIDPYTYLIDVLQRVGQHPASRVDELIPRRWKELFGDNPLRSDLFTAV